MEEEKKKSRVLIIGATGRLGNYLTRFSIESGHPTFALIRNSTFSAKLKSLSDAGVTLLQGSLEDEKSLEEAVSNVDVVISAIPSKHVLDQKLLIKVIKQAGSIKRFIPAEYGANPDKAQVSDLDHGFYSKKSEIKRMIETEGIPHTYICCGLFMRMLLPSLVQPGLQSPPIDKVTVFGDGNVKAVFVNDVDVAAFTIKTIDDPRTLDKTVYLRPPKNICSMNDLVELWEGKIKKKLEKTFVTENQLLKKIKETPYPDNMEMVFIYSVFIKGDHTYFDIESCGGVNEISLHFQNISVFEEPISLMEHFLYPIDLSLDLNRIYIFWVQMSKHVIGLSKNKKDICVHGYESAWLNRWTRIDNNRDAKCFKEINLPEDGRASTGSMKLKGKMLSRVLDLFPNPDSAVQSVETIPDMNKEPPIVADRENSIDGTMKKQAVQLLKV